MAKRKKSKKKKEDKTHLKVLEGTVASKKMAKTIVVEVISQRKHPLYKKIVHKTKRYKAHCERDVNVGDTVKIKQTRPLSKTKRWRVIK